MKIFFVKFRNLRNNLINQKYFQCTILAFFINLNGGKAGVGNIFTVKLTSSYLIYIRMQQI